MAYDRIAAVDEGYRFPPEVRAALALSPELRNGIPPMSNIDKNNLLGADLWDGRMIYNTTTNRINWYDLDASLWREAVEQSDFADLLSTAEPSAVGTTTWVGDDTAAARADHRHKASTGRFGLIGGSGMVIGTSNTWWSDPSRWNPVVTDGVETAGGKLKIVESGLYRFNFNTNETASAGASEWRARIYAVNGSTSQQLAMCQWVRQFSDYEMGMSMDCIRGFTVGWEFVVHWKAIFSDASNPAGLTSPFAQFSAERIRDLP